MNKFHIENCPLCGDTNLKQVLTCTDFYVSGEQFDICRCGKCTFTFTQDFPYGSDVDHYYDSSTYISHTDTKEGIVNRAYHLVRKHMLRKKVNLVIKESHRKSGKLLDVGTGTGYFPAAIKNRGWEVEAVEKNFQARVYAKEKFGLNVEHTKALENYSPGTFDVITLWHVLEHLEDLDGMWEKFNHLLAGSGILIIAVPNCASYDARHYGAVWAAYDVPRHLWHFTPATIREWGAKNGFVLAERYPMPFDAFYISMLSERNKGDRFAYVKGMLIGTWAWLKTLTWKDNSSSMIYVFRKKRNDKEEKK